MNRPIGTARVVIASASAFLLLLCVALAVVFGVANGLLVLATVFLGVFAWAVRAHDASCWKRPDA